MTVAKMSVAELETFLHREFPQAFSSGEISIERGRKDLSIASAL